MKKIALSLAVIVSFSVVRAESFEQTWRQLSNNRLASLIKAAGCVGCAYFAGEHALRHFAKGEDNFCHSFASTFSDGGWDNVKSTLRHGVITGGMTYVAWKLLQKAVVYGQHALGGK